MNINKTKLTSTLNSVSQCSFMLNSTKTTLNNINKQMLIDDGFSETDAQNIIDFKTALTAFIDTWFAS